MAARKEGFNVDFLKEPARKGVMNKVEEEDYISLQILIVEGLNNSVDKEIKVVIDKVDGMDKRLREVEPFVKEAKEKMQCEGSEGKECINKGWRTTVG